MRVKVRVSRARSGAPLRSRWRARVRVRVRVRVTSPIQMAGLSSGCIAAKKTQNCDAIAHAAVAQASVGPSLPLGL